MHSVAATTLDALAADHDAYGLVASGELYDLLRESGIVAGRRVLDLAVRSGRASEPLAHAGARVTGVDRSPAMLAKARVRLPQAELVQAHPEHLPFADGAFDAAIAADAFHLVDDQRAALAQLLRVVRRGGPVALWFTVFSRDADVLAHRGAASRLLGLSPVPEPLSGGFRSFYAAPFAGRSLRVVPRILDTTVAGWIGFERTRAEVWAAYGERADAWYDALEAELVRAYGRTEARMRVPCVQYVYVGRV